MSDYLIELSENPLFRRAVNTLGLPLPMPQSLARADGPNREQELAGKKVLLAGSGTGKIATFIEQAGAAIGPAESLDGLVFDATGIKKIEELAAMYSFFHDNIRALAANGRVVVVARDAAPSGPAVVAAAAAAATGFVKSCAKEIGKKGATANVLYLQRGADSQLAGPLRFLLSARSAFVDGQPIRVGKNKGPAGKAPLTAMLDGKVALVTGAARGIGEVTARRLTAEGARVIVLDIPSAQAEAEKLASELKGVALPLDITAANAVSAIAAAAEPLGGLDIVVNNAGVTRDKTLANMGREHWDMALNVNLAAALAISEGALRSMRPGGRVVCLSSIAGIAGNFGQTNYGAAKAGLIGAVRNLAPAFAEKGCTVNAVAPGFIETQMTAAVPFVTREAGRRLSMLGQGGLPLDVAELITFLATPAASGVNGQVIRVCGGSFLGA